MRTFLAALALTLSLAACGDDDEITSGGASERPETSAEQTSATETALQVPPACDLADESDVEAAYGEDVPPGSPASGGYDEDGVQYQSDNCRWAVDDGLNLSLAVSVAADYPDGELVCPELDSFGEVGTPVPALGDGASWVTDGVDPNEGTLRVCLDEANFDVDVESPEGTRDPDTLRAQSVALAQVVLANLGGDRTR